MAMRRLLKRSRANGHAERGETPVRHDKAADWPISPLATWPAFPPQGYLGQLRDEFQAEMVAERAQLRRQDCRFYHAVELPNGDVIEGPWDLRGRERDYLGHVELDGRRILELGPSTGHLSFFMERQGADVVCFDAGWDVSIDLTPAPGGETRQLRLEHARMTQAFSNSWWYLHREYDSLVKMVYGNIYDLPGDIGEFDVSTFGSILLHLRSPIAALEQAARRTRSTIVVTDTWPDGPDTLYENIMRPFPNGEDGRWVLWWKISAGAVIEMLKILGFSDTHVTEHAQPHQHGHRPDVPYFEQPMYTVVGHRT